MGMEEVGGDGGEWRVDGKSEWDVRGWWLNRKRNGEKGKIAIPLSRYRFINRLHSVPSFLPPKSCPSANIFACW